jgi:hypothetical protein
VIRAQGQFYFLLLSVLFIEGAVLLNWQDNNQWHEAPDMFMYDCSFVYVREKKILEAVIVYFHLIQQEPPREQK